MSNDNDLTNDRKINISFNRHRKYLRVIIYVVLLIASVIIVSNQGGTFSYVFFYGVLLYIPLTFFYMIYMVYSLRLSQELDERMFRKGTIREYRIILENNGFLPIGSISFVWENIVSEYEEDFSDRLFSLFPHEVLKLNNELACRYAGDHEVGITGVKIRDPFKIIELSYRVSTPLRAIVLPAVSDVAETDLNRAYSDMNYRSGRITVNSDEDYLGNDIRKYTYGDRMSMIHWKSYARTRNLLVRIPEYKSSQMLSLIIIKDSMDGSEESMKKRDYFLEYIVSIMNYFAKNKKPLEIVYYDMEVRRFIIDNYDSFQKAYYEVIKRIMSKKAAEEEDGLAQAVGRSSSRKIVFKEKDLVLCQN
ncbi:MAG: DUF58 domain-containing protein [Eubacterium sp.]|nr:DUF58 domain-containing protein [Eubacterium sp.]